MMCTVEELLPVADPALTLSHVHGETEAMEPCRHLVRIPAAERNLKVTEIDSINQGLSQDLETW